MNKKSLLIQIVCVLAGILFGVGIMIVKEKYDTEKEAAKRQELPWMELYEEPQTQGNIDKEEAVKSSPDDISDVPIKWISDYPKINSTKSLDEKAKEKSSFEETMEVNEYDRGVIENCTIDFSNVKITMLGDSITCGVNLSEEEAAEYSVPAVLQKILGCREVVDLGIGGSSVSRAGADPMVERYHEIDKDSDIIIVFGGSNDCLSLTKEQFGSLDADQRMRVGTFCGDLDELCADIQYEYQTRNGEKNSKLLYINPPSTIIGVELYERDPDNKVYQMHYAEAINAIAPKYGFEVIDLYNNNILNSIDFDVDRELVPDGIHMNKEGYRILAEHIASQIIQRIEKE